MAFTHDEKFMIAVYKFLQNQEDPEEPFDPVPIGQSIGLNPKGIEGICKNLRRTNFLKKSGEQHFTLTSQGERLVRSLLEE